MAKDMGMDTGSMVDTIKTAMTATNVGRKNTPKVLTFNNMPSTKGDPSMFKSPMNQLKK